MAEETGGATMDGAVSGLMSCVGRNGAAIDGDWI